MFPFDSATCLSRECDPTLLSYLLYVCSDLGGKEAWGSSEEIVSCRLGTQCVCVLKSQGWINCDLKGPFWPSNIDHLSFLLPFLMFLLPGIELDVEETVSDDLKTAYKHPTPLITMFLPAEGLSQAEL